MHGCPLKPNLLSSFNRHSNAESLRMPVRHLIHPASSLYSSWSDPIGASCYHYSSVHIMFDHSTLLPQCTNPFLLHRLWLFMTCCLALYKTRHPTNWETLFIWTVMHCDTFFAAVLFHRCRQLSLVAQKHLCANGKLKPYTWSCRNGTSVVRYEELPWYTGGYFKNTDYLLLPNSLMRPCSVISLPVGK